MIINTLWIGKIGTMERMSVNSYLKHGHTVHLYSYDRTQTADDLFDMPAASDIELLDANKIVLRDRIGWFPSPAIFSDYFRYSLLRDQGGFWSDLDAICLRSFDDLDANPYLFASDNIDQFFVSGNFMKTPEHAPIVEEGAGRLERMSDEERNKLGHMDPGPYWLQKAVPEFDLLPWVMAKDVLDPIPYTRITQIVDPARVEELENACKTAHAIHLRKSIWDEGANSCAGILPDGTKLMIDKKYDDACLWEKLKRELL